MFKFRKKSNDALMEFGYAMWTNRKRIAKKGQIMYCPDCHKPLMKVIHDIHGDTRISTKLFEAIPPYPQPIDDVMQRFVCAYCGGDLMKAEFKDDE